MRRRMPSASPENPAPAISDVTVVRSSAARSGVVAAHQGGLLDHGIEPTRPDRSSQELIGQVVHPRDGASPRPPLEPIAATLRST